MLTKQTGMTKLKINVSAWGVVAKYAGVLLAFYVFSYATMTLGAYTTFAFGLFFALLAIGLNGWITAGLYVVGYGLANLSLPGLYAALGYAVVGLLMWFISQKMHRSFSRYVWLAGALLGSVPYLYFYITDLSAGISAGISVFLGLLFFMACFHFFSALKKGFTLQLTIDEVISGSIILMVLGMGSAAMEVPYFECAKFLGAILVLLTSYLFPPFYALFVGSVFGLGASLFSGNLVFVSVYVTFALLAAAFKSNHKLYSCLAILLAEVLFGVLFKAYEVFTVFSVVSLALGEMVVLSLPQRVYDAVKTKISGQTDKVAVRNFINHSKQSLTKRMNDMAGVFSEMNTVFRSMVRGLLPVEDAKKMLTGEVLEKVSENSPELAKMLRADSAGAMQVFKELVDIGFERGKVTLLDIPPFITANVGKVNYIISTINQLLNSYKHYAAMVTNMDASRIIIADQLSGLSTILRTLAQEVNVNISFDQSKEKRIMEECTYQNMACLEAVVYQQNAHTNTATLLVKENTVQPEALEKIVSKVLGSKMKIMSNTPSTISGYVLLMLTTRPNHDIVFGSATSGKTGTGVNGDVHSLIKIEEGKYMVALCDGMGSGEKANKTSSLSMGLIENFYKAGFDNEIILNSVNKLLTQNAGEAFSALDICVIDTKKGLCDFIKLGSPQGYIKHKNTTERIETCGLPMGILEEMQPHITKKVLSDYDMILLLSDGITQAFDKAEVSLDEFINTLQSTNPQTLANDILDRAVDLQNGICGDDMTVLAVRVYALA